MYFPYFHGKQYELLAVRAMTQAGRPLDRLCPIIEPVDASPNGLVRCLDACQNTGLHVAVVCNPAKGDFAQENALSALQDTLRGLLPTTPVVLPCLQTNPGLSVDGVRAFLAWAAPRPVGIIHRGPLPEATAAHLLALPSIALHVVMPGVPGMLVGALPARQRVMIEDPFVREVRNADYGPPRFFSDAWKSVLPQNRGIGDYLCIGSRFAGGGGPAIAVAIHALFKAANGDLWLEHFISDDQQYAGVNIGGKFLEAAGKLMAAVDARPQQFGFNPGLEGFREAVATGHSPGLGKSKEWQMIHHMCLTLDVMMGVL